MNEALVKSLSDLIDETLSEIEGLKKSRLEAEEISLGDKEANGSMDTHEVHKADDEDADDEEGDDEEGDDEEMEKGVNDEAEMKKAEDEIAKAEKLLKEAMKKKEACMAKAEKKKKMKKEDDEEAEEEREEAEDKDDNKGEEKMEKSIRAHIAPIEAKMEEMMKAISAIAKSPVPARGVSFKDVQPLAKSLEAAAPMAKSHVLNELINLKKSGRDVVSEDVLRAELGNQSEVDSVANKYGIK